MLAGEQLIPIVRPHIFKLESKSGTEAAAQAEIATGSRRDNATGQ
jgi:hypothetical protein